MDAGIITAILKFSNWIGIEFSLHPSHPIRQFLDHSLFIGAHNLPSWLWWLCCSLTSLSLAFALAQTKCSQLCIHLQLAFLFFISLRVFPYRTFLTISVFTLHLFALSHSQHLQWRLPRTLPVTFYTMLPSVTWFSIKSRKQYHQRVFHEPEATA